MKPQTTPAIVAVLLCIVFVSGVQAQTNVITYQGRLTEGGLHANGLYDFSFELFSDSVAGSSLGTVTNTGVPVSNGLFTTQIDVGPGVFDGMDLWLEIAAVTNGGGSFTTLSPRQPITSAPYAIHASTLSPNGLAGGTYSNAVIFNNAGGSFTGTFLGSGSGLTGLDPANLSPGSADIDITGNAATAVLASNATSLAGIQASTYARTDISNTFTGTQFFADDILVGGLRLVDNATNVDFLIGTNRFLRIDCQDLDDDGFADLGEVFTWRSRSTENGGDYTFDLSRATNSGNDGTMRILGNWEVTGDATFGTNTTVAFQAVSGAPPFTVSSTTQVANLNAAYLNGYTSDAFPKLTTTNTYEFLQIYTNSIGLGYKIKISDDSTNRMSINFFDPDDILIGGVATELYEDDDPVIRYLPFGEVRSVRWEAGDATGTANGGNVEVFPGEATGSGTNGVMKVNGGATLGASQADPLTFAGSLQGSTPFIFDGAVPGGDHTLFKVEEPTATNTVTLPNASGTVALSQAGVAVGEPTPAVDSLSVLALEGYGAPQQITDLIGGVEGQVVVLIGGSNPAAPTVQDNDSAPPGNFRLNSNIDWQALPNHTLTLARFDGIWYEVARSQN